MIQRIRQLAEQATSIVDVKHEGYRGKGYTEQVEFFDKEKFAELIVRECIEISNQHPSKIFKKEWDADAVAWDITQRIKGRFGVEE